MCLSFNTKLEIEFINLFVTKHKRGRLIEFASKPNKRDYFINELKSPGIFEEKYLYSISGYERESNLSTRYRQNGMSGRVYTISENSEWDGTKFQMSYILEECRAQCIDTVGYCWKTKTAFYEWHHSGESYFLTQGKFQ